MTGFSLPESESNGADWDARFERLLLRCVGADRSRRLLTPFLSRFGSDYRVRVGPAAAVRDCLNIETLSSGHADLLDLRHELRGGHRDCLRWMSRCERPLDECIPLIRHCGLRVLDQVQFVTAFDGGAVYLRLFDVESRGGAALTPRHARVRLIETLQAVLSGRAANDALNGLVIAGDLSWPDVDILRAYCNYANQLGGLLRRRLVEQALLNNPPTARLLFRYFEARFDPARGSSDLRQREESLLEPLRAALSDALNAVTEVGDDRTLRHLFNLIDATLRTNFYRRRGEVGPALALKIDSFGVIDMAAPRPAYEIYVHAADFEGIHLRGAKVARGGIRWSDRQEDLRGEILDLQQTQMIKNSLIVPQGAKGGFVLKRPPREPEARRAAARQAYRRFIGALLDVTDRGPKDAGRVHPSVLTYDASDPYLVVAADKGTAGFSDLANEVADQQEFWLGDAFASGGSRGFSHKRFGITARGAWECVRRHFREMNRDIEREAISVVGIGSMDGDVFGNGMLLSRNIRLLGAFSANHIFLDPDPNGDRSLRERQRLFDLAGSTWGDYDRALLSRGGGVFLRSAKRIPLAPEIRDWLRVRYDTIDGDGLIRLLLTAPVDLLWFGGIGTYVKGADESNDQVADHTNDGVRVDAAQLRAKVIGEGANLGLTQQARIEYALQGGRINMDALDNSAGVDLSDHEVNLKILLGHLASEGLIAGPIERDALLETLASEVCGNVLAHNRSQSLCLSLDQARCRREPETFLALSERLANLGFLDRGAADVPDRNVLLARAGQCLTRPELTVLLARTKLALKSLLLKADGVLRITDFADLYQSYFPLMIRTSFGERLAGHPLAYEITVSQICNTVIDRAGVSFLTWVEEPTPELIARAISLYRLFDRTLDAHQQWHAICAASPPDTELRLLLGVEDALATLCRWGLRKARRLQLDEQTLLRWRSDWEQYRECIKEMPPEFQQAPSGGTGELAEAAADAPAMAGARIPSGGWLELFPFVTELKRQAGCSMHRACDVYLALAGWFGWPQIAVLLESPAAHDRDRLARRALAERFLDGFRRLCLGFFRSAEGDPIRFLESLKRRGTLNRVGRLRGELAAASASAALELMILLLIDLEAAVDQALDTLEDF